MGHDDIPKHILESEAFHAITLDACEQVTDGLARELALRGVTFESLAQVYAIKEDLLAIVRKYKLSIDLEVQLFCMMLNVAVRVKQGKVERTWGP